MGQRFSYSRWTRTCLVAGAVVLLGFSGCGKKATVQTNTNTSPSVNTNSGANPYTFPSYIHPEQIGNIIISEGGVLFAAINEINKYAHPEVIELYNLNPSPEISDEYNFLGILRSEDNGLTWTEALKSKQDQDHKRLEDIITCREKNGTDVAYAHFRSLRADNTTDKAGSFHIYVSKDGGKKWDDDGTFALKKGSDTDIILATFKDQSQLDGIPLASLKNLNTQEGSCGTVWFENDEKNDTIKSKDYGKTWERIKK